MTMTMTMTTDRCSSAPHQLVLTERIALPISSHYDDDDDDDAEAAITEALLITLNRPTKKNCFNTQLCRELATVFYNVANEIEGYDNDDLTTATADDTDGVSDGDKRRRRRRIVAVLFTGAGQSFCAGADLTNPPNPIHQSSDLAHHLRYNPVYQISRVGVPIIGVLRGHVITGGFELALACDILLGDTTTTFRDTHVKFGLAPCWGLSQNLCRRIGIGRAKLVSFSAQPVTAERAYEWGLLDELVMVPPPVASASHSISISVDGNKATTTTMVVDPVLYRALELAEAISSNNPLMVRRYKRAIVEGTKLNYSNGLQRERELGLAHYMEIVGDGRTFESAKEYIVDHDGRQQVVVSQSKL
ncbi:LOW QUALITY PROTEIN: hypothetical protein ACHAWU_002975 [Discostella pseudostelligera]|uniref:Enoyl-CoA hydratase n=1 Tax=Discostella pseudostelligera TaxID=259834 RepID=A0ABD3M315_9STRA